MSVDIDMSYINYIHFVGSRDVHDPHELWEIHPIGSMFASWCEAVGQLAFKVRQKKAAWNLTGNSVYLPLHFSIEPGTL